jgi:hypothetical protein
MNKLTILGAFLGGSAALTMLAGTPALAQMQSFPNGIDCSKLPPFQQTDCRVQQQSNTTTPWVAPPPVRAGNGAGTNQDGSMTPNGSSGDTNGSSYGAGGGNGGASPPGQSGN